MNYYKTTSYKFFYKTTRYELLQMQIQQAGERSQLAFTTSLFIDMFHKRFTP